MQRLATEIQHITELIAFCGDKAKRASQELLENHLLSERPKFVFLGHPGTIGLNKITIDLNGNSIVNAQTQRRIGRSATL